MKYLIHFEKGEPARWLGHLDILRTFERAVRRSNLPVAFSAGFNPRVKISFASALSCGVTGAEEPAMLELTDALPADEVKIRLNDALPPGVRIRSAISIADIGSRDLLNNQDSAEYRVTCACAVAITFDQAVEAVNGLLNTATLTRDCVRKGRPKPIDLRPHIREIEVLTVETERLTLRIVLAVKQDGSIRPSEVIAALSEALHGITVRRIHRIRMFCYGSTASDQPSAQDEPNQPYVLCAGAIPVN